jgi:hypothetical protein
MWNRGFSARKDELMGKSCDINGYSSIALYCSEQNNLVLQNARPIRSSMSGVEETTFVLPFRRSCKSQYQSTVKLCRISAGVGVLCAFKETILEGGLEFLHKKY